MPITNISIDCGGGRKIERIFVHRENKVFGLDTGDELFYTLHPITELFSFLTGNKFADKFLMNSNPSSEMRDVSITFSNGIVYKISFYPAENKVFSESFYNGNELLLYRDRLDAVPIIGKGISTEKGNLIIDSLMSIERTMKDDHPLKLLRHSSFGYDAFIEFNRTVMYDFEEDSSGESSGSLSAFSFINSDFTDSELEIVNKIVPNILDASIKEVKADGSYLIGNITLPKESGGGGYRQILNILKLLIRSAIDDDRTLILCNWGNHLHPIVRNYIKTFPDLNIKGSVFLIDSKDED